MTLLGHINTWLDFYKSEPEILEERTALLDESLEVVETGDVVLGVLGECFVKLLVILDDYESYFDSRSEEIENLYPKTGDMPPEVLSEYDFVAFFRDSLSHFVWSEIILTHFFEGAIYVKRGFVVVGTEVTAEDLVGDEFDDPIFLPRYPN